MKRAVLVMVVGAVLMVGTGCVEPLGDTSPPPTAPPLTEPPPITIGPTTTSTTAPGVTSTSTTSPTATTVPTPISIELPNVFGQQAAGAIEQIQALGLAVVAYEVCSGSVGLGEVRQVVTLDGKEEVELVGTAGVTESGRQVSPFSILEVKIGSGAACG